MANEFGTTKSVFILTIVAGCFAILWPNVFYPMVHGDYYDSKVEAEGNGCCDVIFDNDVNGIKIMTELCEKILNRDDLKNDTLKSFTQGKLSKNTIELCKETVLKKCDLDITELLSRNIALGKDYKQTLDLLRTLNSSICLRESFGVSLGQIGLPRQMRVWGLNISKHMKPERPAHLHPDMLHPALREKGRAIQQAKKASVEIKAGSPSLPGMRPTLGGAGHIVPPPKGGTTMGIVMPMYTIGIVVFFMYTLLRLMFKKGGEDQECEELTCDADFQHDVFGLNPDFIRDNSDSTKLGDLELEMLKERLQETEKAMERIVAKMMTLPKCSSSKDTPDELKEESENVNEPAIGSCNDCDAIANVETSPEAQIVQEEESAPTEEEVVDTKAGVKVIGMETTETCEEGKWCRPETPRSSTPQNIYLPAVLPDQSKIIVTNSSTETIASSQDNAPVVLSGKVTLSLIGLQDVSVSDDVDSYHEATMKMTTECLSGTVPNVHSGKTKDQPKIDDIEDKIIVNNG